MELIKPKRIDADRDNDNSDYGYCSLDYTDVKLFLDTLNGAGVSYTDNSGAFKINYSNKSYTYWPKSGKWRVKGSPTIYRSKDIRHFINDYVLKYYKGYYS